MKIVTHAENGEYFTKSVEFCCPAIAKEVEEGNIRLGRLGVSATVTHITSSKTPFLACPYCGEKIEQKWRLKDKEEEAK